MTDLLSSIPITGFNLGQSGRSVIEHLGESAVKEAVFGILTGQNIRSLTEGLTRRRLVLSNAALLSAYLRAAAGIPNFSEELPGKILHELVHAKLSKEQKNCLLWLVGLTGKGVQNILRGNKEAIEQYINGMDQSVRESTVTANNQFGELSGEMVLDNHSLAINWLTLSRIFTAIGTQTLAIRGAEKSIYGKLFEKLVLGTVLTILGFSKTDKTKVSEQKNVFWLSERGDKRESDATLLLELGEGIRFDIGFIGPGNTEISLDKVSRFEKQMEYGQGKFRMSTLILVDRIGEKSRIPKLAKQIGGRIIQMSMSNWVSELAQIISEKTSSPHPYVQMREKAVFRSIKEKIKSVVLTDFLS